MIKNIVIVVIVLLLIGGGLFLNRLMGEAEKSQMMEVNFLPPEDMKLGDCGKPPNCVSSSSPKDDSHFVAPFDCPSEEKWSQFIEKLPSLDLKLELRSGNYVHLTYRSEIFEFVDDIELLFTPEENLIQVRSASRVGYSDMDANLKRYEQMKALFTSLN